MNTQEIISDEELRKAANMALYQLNEYRASLVLASSTVIGISKHTTKEVDIAIAALKISLSNNE